VSKNGVKHAAFAVAEHHECRLVLSSAAGARIGIRRGENTQILGGATQAIVEFILRVLPNFRKTASDGMLLVSRGHLIFVLLAVMTSLTRLGLKDHFPIFPSHEWTALLIATHPSSDSDHPVVFEPIGEGIVRGMYTDEAAAVLHVLFEGFHRFSGPLAAAAVIGIVRDDNFVGFEIGFESAHFSAFRRRGGDIHLKESGLFQQFLQHGSGQLPLMIVLPIDDQRLLRSGGSAG